MKITKKLYKCWLSNSGEGQRVAEQFINREVYQCASYLIAELATNDKYCDELSELFGNEDNEIFEHWIISEYLATKLEKEGEAICKDFYGLTLWGRGCTGQAISLDSVICDIIASNNLKYLDAGTKAQVYNWAIGEKQLMEAYKIDL